MDADEILQRLELEDRRRTECVRVMLREAGRDDLVADLDARLRDIRLGLDGARSAWHSISPAQRRVMEALEPGRHLARQPHRPRYHAVGPPHIIANICGLPTVRNLCVRELLVCAGGVFDPEALLVLTERARFMLKHGRPPHD